MRPPGAPAWFGRGVEFADELDDFGAAGLVCVNAGIAAQDTTRAPSAEP
jgi:hypothetical protein